MRDRYEPIAPEGSQFQAVLAGVFAGCFGGIWLIGLVWGFRWLFVCH